MTLRRVVSLATRARVSSVSASLDLSSFSFSSSSSVHSAFLSSSALSSQFHRSGTYTSIHEHIHGSGCGCGGCGRVGGAHRGVSGFSAGLPKVAAASSQATEVREDSTASTDSTDIPTGAVGTERGGSVPSGGEDVDVSFIHPVEQQNYTEAGGSYWLMQPVYDADYLEMVKPQYVFYSRSLHDFVVLLTQCNFHR